MCAIPKKMIASHFQQNDAICFTCLRATVDQSEITAVLQSQPGDLFSASAHAAANDNASIQSQKNGTAGRTCSS